MDVLAHAVEVDAHALILVMGWAAVDDVRGGGPDGAADIDLFAAGAFAEAGPFEQVPEPPLCVVDRLANAFLRPFG